MMMRVLISEIKRQPKGLDFSDITSSVMGEPFVVPHESLTYTHLEIPFDPPLSPEEEEAIVDRLTTTNAVEETLRKRARQAIGLNNQWLDLAAPTNAQALAYLDTVARELNALIRLGMRWLDSTD